MNNYDNYNCHQNITERHSFTQQGQYHYKISWFCLFTLALVTTCIPHEIIMIIYILHSRSKTSSFPLGFFTCIPLYDFAAFQSIHYKLLTLECFNSLHTFQEILSHCTHYNCSIKLEMLKFIPVLMAILLLLHTNAQHFNCRLLQEDTLCTRLIYLINDMIFDDSITLVQVLMVHVQLLLVCHCEYKHHRHTYVHAHTSTPHKPII